MIMLRLWPALNVDDTMMEAAELMRICKAQMCLKRSAVWSNACSYLGKFFLSLPTRKDHSPLDHVVLPLVISFLSAGAWNLVFPFGNLIFMISMSTKSDEATFRLVALCPEPLST